MSNVIKHKARSRVTYQNNAGIFRGFESRANIKKGMRDSKKNTSVFGKLVSKAKSLFRKNQGK